MEMQFVLFWKLVDCELYIYLSLAAKAVRAAFRLMKRLAALLCLESFGCLNMCTYVCAKSLQLHVYLFIWLFQKCTSWKPTEMISNKSTTCAQCWNSVDSALVQL